MFVEMGLLCEAITVIPKVVATFISITVSVLQNIVVKLKIHIDPNVHSSLQNS